MDSSWTGTRLMVAKCFQTILFRCTIGSIIFLHVCMTVYETDHRVLKKDIPGWFPVIVNCCLAIYCLELVLRIYVSRVLFFFFPMNVFDFVLIVVDIISEVRSSFGDEGSGISLSGLRIARVLRIIRAARMFLVFRELYMMLHGLASALKAIVWASAMIAVTILMCSIVCMELILPLQIDLEEEYADCSWCMDAFEGVAQSSFTLFQLAVVGEGHREIVQPIIMQHGWTVSIFAFAYLFIAIGILNLIVAVIVDRAAEARHEDTENLLSRKVKDKQRAMRRFERLFIDADIDQDGQITFDEFRQCCQSSPELADTMRLMDLRLDDADLVFEILDADGGGTVDRREFADQLLKMSNQDEHTLLIFIHHEIKMLKKRLFKHPDQSSLSLGFGSESSSPKHGTLPLAEGAADAAQQVAVAQWSLQAEDGGVSGTPPTRRLHLLTQGSSVEEPALQASMHSSAMLRRLGAIERELREQLDHLASLVGAEACTDFEPILRHRDEIGLVAQRPKHQPSTLPLAEAQSPATPAPLQAFGPERFDAAEVDSRCVL